MKRKTDKSMDDGMSIIVKVAAYVLAVPITILGLYIILHGHLTPGGGFPGGAVIATLTVLFLVAAGKEKAKALKKDMISFAGGVGLVMFAFFGFIGTGTTFFYNILANSGSLFGMRIPFGVNPGYMWTAGVIPPMNMAVGLEVAASLSLIALVMFLYTMEDER
jgi:multicomponent Na+:H+ antiporter subunit B